MRLFLALLPVEQFNAALVRIQSMLKNAGLQGHYTPQENLHLTLAFIGEYTHPEDVLSCLPPFSKVPLTLRGLGNFNTLLYAGIETGPELFDYVQIMRDALALHQIPFDQKPFLPHITLVRNIRLPAPEIMLPPASAVAEHISLMQSVSGPHGMIYTEIGRI